MPDGVSTMRGGAWPSRGSRNRPLTATPPSVERSTTSLYSRPYPKQPLAAISGLGSLREPIETERSMSVCECVPDDPARIEHGAFDAGTDEMRRGVRLAREHDAAV